MKSDVQRVSDWLTEARIAFGTVYVVSNVNTSAGVVTLNCKTDWWES